MRKLFVLLTLLFTLLFSTIIHAEESTPRWLSRSAQDIQQSNYVDLEGEPSAVVAGSVNMITGNYFDASVDMAVPGAEPIVMERRYTGPESKFKQKDIFRSVWVLNNLGVIERHHKNSDKNSESDTFYVEDSTGFGGAYVRQGDVFRVSWLQLRYGVTNAGAGLISGKTNVRNHRLELAQDTAYPFLFEGRVFTGSGGLQIYKKLRGGCHPDLYDLSMEYKPSGNYIKHCYDESGRPLSIQSLNKFDQPIAKVDIEYSDHDGNTTVKAAGGEKTVVYTYEKHRDRSMLMKVQRQGWTESYKYTSWGGLLRKDTPNRHFREIEYYSKGNNSVGDANIVLPKHDPSLRKVKLLKAPVGTDATPIITHRFFYAGGASGVYDALGHKTDYAYDESKRLTDIIKYHGSEPHSLEKFYWKKNGDLLSRTFAAWNGPTQCCRHLNYDGNGNVISEDLYGNLTGRNQSPVVVDADGTPQKNGCETYAKCYIHSNDGFNLLQLETDGRRKLLYSYYPQTELVKTRYLLSADDQIRLRQFFVYDHSGCLIAEVTDNGTSLNHDDQTNVTERRVKRIQTRTIFPVGYPEVIEENAFDYQLNVERRVHKTVNHYSSKGYLIQQDHYGSDGIFAYSLFWEYGKRGYIKKEINAIGEVTTFEHDAYGNKISEQGPNPDLMHRYTYDFSNRLIKEEDVYTNGIILAKSHRYDYLGQRIATTDIYGNETSFFYDEHGNVVEVRNPFVFDENQQVASPIVKCAYDVMGHPVLTIDPKGLSTAQTFNIRGQPLTVTHPDGTCEKNFYTFDGFLETSIAANGVTTVNQVDYQGRVICQEVTSPGGILLSKKRSTYDAFHLTSETDALGNVTNYTYDYAGRLETVVHGNSKISIQYDPLGRIAKRLDHSSENEYTIHAYTYDLLGRTVEERKEDSSGNVQALVRYGYDIYGNRNEVRHYGQAGESITRIVFNAYHEPEIVTDPEGHVTRTIFHYYYLNALNQYVKAQEVIDPIGNSKFIECDAIGWVASVNYKDPFGNSVRTETFRYDLAGNRTHSIEGDQVTALEYDNCNRLTCCTEAQGTPSQKVTRKHYNNLGQLEHLIKPDGTTLIYLYDVLGRLHSFTSSDKSFGYVYTYDANSNVVSVEDTYNHRQTVKSYDANNRMIAETLGNGLTISYAYDGQGRITKAILPDNSCADYTYDAAFLKKVVRKDLAYTYDFDQSARILATTMPGEAGVIRYRCDLLGRLRETDAPYFREILGSFDDAGRLLRQTISDVYKTDNQNFSYDALNQLLTENGHAYTYDSHYNCISKDGISHVYNPLNQLLSDGENTYSYDSNGNLTEQVSDSETTRYAYDALDRLISVTIGTQKHVYTYDETNRRLTKQAFFLQGDTWVEQDQTYFLYQGINEIGAYTKEHEPIEQRILGIGKGAEIGAAVFIEIQGNTYIPIHDHNGSITALLSPTGEQKEGVRYTAFGEEDCYLSASNPWRFASKRTDSETGLIYFGNRYYNPKTHRWVTADPIGTAGGPNLYAYLNNNPLGQFDPLGLTAGDDDRNLHEKNSNRISERNNSSDRVTERTRDRDEANVNTMAAAVVREVSPIPLIREAVLLVKAIAMGQYPGTHSFLKGDSRNFWTENGVFDPYCIILASNGVETMFDDFKQRCENFAQKTGLKVYCSYNATNGIVYDGFESFMNIAGLPTHVGDLKVEAFNFCNELLAPGGIMVDVSFSQGGLITNYAAGKLSPGVKGKIHAFGMGTVIYDKKNFKKSMTYLSTCDGVAAVCNLHQPHKYIGAALGLVDNATFIKGKYPIIDHAYANDAYQEAERLIIRDINQLRNRK